MRSTLTRTLPRSITGAKCFCGNQVDSRPLWERNSASAAKLGDRLMVGQCPLEALVQVRILVAQPRFEAVLSSVVRFSVGSHQQGLADN